MVDGKQYEDILATFNSHESSANIAQSIAHSAFGKTYNGRKDKYLGSF